MFLKHIHFDPAVDGGAGGGAAGADGSGGAQPWSASLPPEFTLEHDGKQVPAKDAPFVKDFPDLPSLVKQAYDMKRAVSGGLTKIPGKDSKPEDVAAWKKDNFGKLAAAGLMELAPDSPDKYEIKPPESMPPGTVWNPEWEKEARKVLHNAGFNQTQVKTAMELHNHLIAGAAAAQIATFETGMAAIKEKWGADFEKNAEIAARAGDAIFGKDGEKDPEAAAYFEKTGIANDPRFLRVMFEIGARMQEHNGNVPSNDGKTDPNAELATFMSDKEKVAKWEAGDPAVTAERDNIMKRIHGTKEVGV